MQNLGSSGSHWVFDDGGRASAGFRGQAKDCFTRALAIASQTPYLQIYNFVNAIAKEMKESGKDVCRVRDRHSLRRSLGDARRGVRNPLFHEVMRRMGWSWIPTMRWGQGCKVHLCKAELPPGRLVCRVTKHMVAVIDGVIHDTYDPSRGSSRCVYGYFTRLPDPVPAVLPTVQALLAPTPSRAISHQAIARKTHADADRALLDSRHATAQHELQRCLPNQKNACSEPDSSRRAKPQPVRKRSARALAALSDDDSDDEMRLRLQRRKARQV